MKRLFVFVFSLLIFCLDTKALFYKGAEGYEVRELQQGLYRAGYYSSAWDGKYTEQVCEAVKAYQRGKGVFPDGICTYALARSLDVPVKYSKEDEDTVRLARLICRVCKDADYLTKLSVGSVAVNRVDSPLFPDGMASVTETLGGAFPCEIPEDCMRAAYEAVHGVKPYGNVLYFEEKKTGFVFSK